MRVTKLEIKDQVNCRFHNLDPATKRRIKAKMKYFMPYAPHTPQYVSGYWDGFEYLFDTGGRTYTALLQPILEFLIDDGWQIELEDKRESYDFEFPIVDKDIFSDKTWPKKHKNEGEAIELMDHQVQALNMFFDNTQCIQELPTSAGKTLITAAMSYFCEPYGKTIVIVPNISLVTQTEEDYKNLGLDVGVYYGGRKELGHTHTICTWQVLNVLEKKSKKHNTQDALLLEQLLHDVIAVIVDEVHQAKAKALKTLLSGALSNVPVRWGLTGTMPKDKYDRDVILSTLGPVVDIVTPKELQEAGQLANCHIDVLQLQDKFEFKDYPTEMKYLTEDITRLEWIAKFIKTVSETGNTLVLVKKINTGEELSKILGTTFVSGKMKNTNRKLQYDEFHDSDDKITVATFGVAAVGINVPRIFNLILVEPGKSFVRVIQSIGRGLRIAKDKDYVHIFDLTSSCKYSKKHLNDRKKYYKEKEYEFNVQKVDWDDR